MRSSSRSSAPRQFVTRESHHLWGRRYLLNVVECDEKPHVVLDHPRVTLVVRPGSTREKRESVVHAWHRSLLQEVIPKLIGKWEQRLGVAVAGYHLLRMKTRWGSCNPRARTIRLNTELV